MCRSIPTRGPVPGRMMASLARRARTSSPSRRPSRHRLPAISGNSQSL
jgi:hypothetical protein